MRASSGRTFSIAADVVEVSGAHGVDEPPDRRALHERLELRPALEAVGAREHQLRVVQRERGRIRVAVMRGDLGGCAGLAGRETPRAVPWPAV